MEKDFVLPFYVKSTIFLIGIFALLTMIYIAQSIILPFIFALLISIILHPVVHLLMRMKINRIISIFLTLLFTVIIIVGITAILYSQAIKFSESWPVIVDKIAIIFKESTAWVSTYFDLSPWKVHQWVAKTNTELINFSGAEIGHTISILGSAVIMLFIIPIYVILMLYYEPLLLSFISKLFAEIHQKKVSQIISQIKVVIQRYLVGLVIEFFIVAILYSTALLLLGVDYAIMLGIIGAVLNVIPYLGAFIAASLSILIALATNSTGWHIIYILLSYYIIHLFDYNFIIPKIVASKVKINALISFLVIISSGALLGIPGMLICIPITGVLKLIFDHIKSLEPWGFLLGDTMPPLIKIKPILKTLKKKIL
ncbi:MAG: AI-2E family transporter [Bacteroidetes bacterium CG2_30_33_31]|nr:MAG: AI-2E family transporter [Bacteroidetes bacterium CG2_30_33_31]